MYNTRIKLWDFQVKIEVSTFRWLVGGFLRVSWKLIFKYPKLEYESLQDLETRETFQTFKTTETRSTDVVLQEEYLVLWADVLTKVLHKYFIYHGQTKHNQEHEICINSVCVCHS